MKEMCCKELWREAHSWRVTEDLEDVNKFSILISSFVHFLSGRETQQFSKSHKKPTYWTAVEKYWPLFSIRCHGTPSGDVIFITVSKSKANKLGALPLGQMAKEIGEQKITTLYTHLKAFSIPWWCKMSSKPSARQPCIPPVVASPSTTM